jgi:hypothetical protein
MAETFTLAVKASISSNQLGGIAINPPLQSGPSDYSSLNYELANGDNTIPVPSGATYCLIVFDQASLTVKKLKGIGGDTGVKVGSIGLVLFSIGAAVSSFIINSSAADTGKVTQIVFF